MGLDAVELILTIEESFGISITDEEAETTISVGQLYDAILQKLPSHDEKFCLSAVTFYQVRRAIMSITGKNRSDIRPTTDMKTLFPFKHRRRSWRRLNTLLNLQLPRLESPQWSIAVALFFSTFATILLFLIADLKFGWHVMFYWLFGTCLIAGIIGILFGTRLRKEIQTVGGFTRAILANNFKKLSSNLSDHYHEEVWHSIRILLAEQLDVDINDVTKEANFVADLGMN